MTQGATNLGAQIAKGTFWTVAMRMAIRLLGVISVIILARILTPVDYGIVAQAVMIYAFMEAITQFGLDNAIISNQHATRDHYDTVWTLHILRGLVVALVMAALAGPAAAFFREPQLEPIIYAYAVISFGSGLINVGIVDFRKHFRFHLDFRYSVWRKLSGFLATVAFALYFRNYWAFVVGTCTSMVVGIIISFYMSTFRPRLCLREWRSLFDFSKWVFPAGIVGAVSTKIDTFILGRMAPTEQLGLYTVSHEVAGAASTEIAMPVARAMMPGLSAVNDDLAAFRSLYSSSMAIVLMIAVPAALGLSALSQLASDVLLGEKWVDAGPIIMVLALYGVGRVITAVSTSAYVAYGRVDIMFKLSVVGLVARSTAFGVGFWIAGFWGLVWGAVFAAAINTAVTLGVQSRLGLLTLGSMARNSWRTLFAAGGMWLVLNYMEIATAYGGMLLLWLLCNRPEGPERELLGYLVARMPGSIKSMKSNSY